MSETPKRWNPGLEPPYPGWAPYCLVCSTMMRMKPTDFGWKCRACGNPINRDLTHHNPVGDAVVTEADTTPPAHGRRG